MVPKELETSAKQSVPLVDGVELRGLGDDDLHTHLHLGLHEAHVEAGDLRIVHALGHRCMHVSVTRCDRMPGESQGAGTAHENESLASESLAETQ